MYMHVQALLADAVPVRTKIARTVGLALIRNSTGV